MMLPMIREITIKPVLNGFVCKVGCQTVVFGDTETLSRQIKAYYDNPEATEATYLRLAVNKTNDGPCVPDPVCMPERAPCDVPSTRLNRVVTSESQQEIAPARK